MVLLVAVYCYCKGSFVSLFSIEITHSEITFACGEFVEGRAD
jgi:hypothetical protein